MKNAVAARSAESENVLAPLFLVVAAGLPPNLDLLQSEHSSSGVLLGSDPVVVLSTSGIGLRPGGRAPGHWILSLSDYDDTNRDPTIPALEVALLDWKKKHPRQRPWVGIAWAAGVPSGRMTRAIATCDHLGFTTGDLVKYSGGDGYRVKWDGGCALTTKGKSPPRPPRLQRLEIDAPERVTCEATPIIVEREKAILACMSLSLVPLARLDLHVRVGRDGGVAITTDGDAPTSECVRKALAGAEFAGPNDEVDVHLLDFAVTRR